MIQVGKNKPGFKAGKILYFGILGTLVLLLAAAAVLGGSMIRKDFPYDIEIVATGDKVGFVNHTGWMDRDLSVRLLGKDGIRIEADLPGETKELVITNLKKNSSYLISIGRKDFQGKIRYRRLVKTITTKNRPYVVLIGASVGAAWDLPNFAKRMKDDRFSMGYREGARGFDKSDALERTLSSELKPDVIIIKECAAYFPRDVEEGVTTIESYIDQITKENIQPVLATCAPVTEKNDQMVPGRLASLNKFNKNIRSLAEFRGIPILDLQKALQESEDRGQLKEEYAARDGLHLTNKAYREVLDPAMKALLDSMFKKRF